MNSRFQIHKIVLLLSLAVVLCSKNVTAQHSDPLSSWIKVVIDLEQYYVVVDKDFGDPHLINRGDSVKVDPGMRHITVVWESINDLTFTVNSKAGETTSRRIFNAFPDNPKSSYQTIVRQTNLSVTTDENSIVYIDGEKIGKHTVHTLLKPGTHQLRITHPEYGELSKKIAVNSINITEVARFNENPSKLTFVAKLVPGAEYIASKRYNRATLTYLSLGLLTVNLIRQDRIYSKELNEHNEWEALYNNAQTSADAFFYRKKTLEVNEKLDQISANFNISLLLMGMIYALTTFDSIRKPRSGYLHSSKLFGMDITLSGDVYNPNTIATLSLKFALN
ncbi:MAG: hypothetical protein CL666_13275 [Balneola sp.]|nr:hypothetical protein [Balneola sp.]|tara:strand:+ start:6467 stop:7471 length:1005 start_codon:yes stop_codon:yes gene_type:complete